MTFSLAISAAVEWVSFAAFDLPIWAFFNQNQRQSTLLNQHKEVCRLFRLDGLSTTNLFSRFPVTRFPVSHFQLPQHIITVLWMQSFSR